VTHNPWARPALETVTDHIDNAADDTPVIDTRHAMRQWKMRDIRAIWRSLSKNKSSIAVSFIKDRESYLNPN